MLRPANRKIRHFPPSNIPLYEGLSPEKKPSAAARKHILRGRTAKITHFYCRSRHFHNAANGGTHGCSSATQQQNFFSLRSSSDNKTGPRIWSPRQMPNTLSHNRPFAIFAQKAHYLMRPRLSQIIHDQSHRTLYGHLPNMTHKVQFAEFIHHHLRHRQIER